MSHKVNAYYGGVVGMWEYHQCSVRNLAVLHRQVPSPVRAVERKTVPTRCFVVGVDSGLPLLLRNLEPSGSLIVHNQADNLLTLMRLMNNKSCRELENLSNVLNL